MTENYVIKMSNGQVHAEWYMSLGVRTQAHCAEEARRFPGATDYLANALPNLGKYFTDLATMLTSNHKH